MARVHEFFWLEELWFWSSLHRISIAMDPSPNRVSRGWFLFLSVAVGDLQTHIRCFMDAYMRDILDKIYLGYRVERDGTVTMLGFAVFDVMVPAAEALSLVHGSALCCCAEPFWGVPADAQRKTSARIEIVILNITNIDDSEPLVGRADDADDEDLGGEDDGEDNDVGQDSIHSFSSQRTLSPLPHDNDVADLVSDEDEGRDPSPTLSWEPITEYEPVLWDDDIMPLDPSTMKAILAPSEEGSTVPARWSSSSSAAVPPAAALALNLDFADDFEPGDESEPDLVEEDGQNEGDGKE